MEGEPDQHRTCSRELRVYHRVVRGDVILHEDYSAMVMGYLKKLILDFALRNVMREMGRKGGKIGGKRRLETMTAEERSHAAYKAAQARWAKRKLKK